MISHGADAVVIAVRYFGLLQRIPIVAVVVLAVEADVV